MSKSCFEQIKWGSWLCYQYCMYLNAPTAAGTEWEATDRSAETRLKQQIWPARTLTTVKALEGLLLQLNIVSAADLLEILVCRYFTHAASVEHLWNICRTFPVQDGKQLHIIYTQPLQVCSETKTKWSILRPILVKICTFSRLIGKHLDVCGVFDFQTDWICKLYTLKLSWIHIDTKVLQCSNDEVGNYINDLIIHLY